LTAPPRDARLGYTRSFMSDHGHHHHHHPTDSSANITLALLLNLGFTVVEIVGGILTGSLAILADALHDAGDSLALGLSLYLEKKAGQESDHDYSYGYRRFSLLGALINGLILGSGSIWVIKEALERISDPPAPHAVGMIGLAVLGLVVNGLGYFKLRKTDSLNQRMVALHLAEDVAGWAVLLLVAVVMHFWQLYFLDPLFSVLFSLFLLFQVFKNLKATLKILLQSTPTQVDLVALQSEIALLEPVLGIHDMHLWSLDGSHHVFTCHLVTDGGLDQEASCKLKAQVKKMALDHGIGHATLELESEAEDCGQQDCGPPPLLG